MNNNFNAIELYKNLLTGLNMNMPKEEGLRINNNIRMVNDVDQPKEEVVTLVLMYDKPLRENKKSKTIYPFLCDI